MSSDDEDADFLSLPSTIKPLHEMDLTAALEEYRKPVAALSLADITSKGAIKRAQRFDEKQKQRGIVYLSRISPTIGPKTIREMLGKFGPLDRIYLKKETDESYKIRKQRTGNYAGGVRYEGGWVEFLDKRHAKKCAIVLNGNPIGGMTSKKALSSDLWCITYLSKVLWADLRQQHQHEGEMRSVKTQKAIEEGRKQTQQFLAQYQESKEKELVQKKKQERIAKREGKTAVESALTGPMKRKQMTGVQNDDKDIGMTVKKQKTMRKLD